MNQKTNILEAKDLVKRFGSFVAVDHVSFNIPEGEIFGLLGPNGAGKTTTIRMLCGLIVQDSGDAIIGGESVRKNPQKVKDQIGYMSQKFSLYQDLTVRENLDFYAAIYGLRSNSVRKARVEELIEQNELGDFSNKTARELSGAWRQRLALSCAIVHKPKMLFLDEATAGVDPVARREFWELIYSLAGGGMSILATTHYMDEADFCNYLGMMYQGKMIKLASPDEVKADYEGALYEVQTTKTEPAINALKEYPAVTGLSRDGALIHVTLKSKDDLEAVEAYLKAQGIELTLEPILPTIEDSFISLVEDQRQE